MLQKLQRYREKKDMSKLQKTIVNRVKGLCEERKLSTYALANRAGIPGTTMFHFMDGSTKNTRISTIVQICDGLEMSLAEFFSTPEFEELLKSVGEE